MTNDKLSENIADRHLTFPEILSWKLFNSSRTPVEAIFKNIELWS